MKTKFQMVLAALIVLATGWSSIAAADDVDNCTWSNAETLVKTNPSVVTSACRRLARAGETWAQYNLATIYDKGLGVTPNYIEAAKWYRRAANKGHPQAQYNLGRLYANGKGLGADFVEAYKWFTIAARALPSGTEQDNAIRNRDKVAKFMTPQEILEAEAVADIWKPKKK
jgi:TPR repeat protein